MDYSLLKPVSLWELRAQCLACGHEFPSYVLPDMVYGEWLLRTCDGKEMAILQCLDNPVFDEVRELVDGLIAREKNRKLQRLAQKRREPTLLDRVMPICCDPLGGAELTTAPPRCPLCQSANVDRFDHDPPRGMGINLPVVTFHRWLAMRPDEREQKVAAKMRALRLEL